MEGNSYLRFSSEGADKEKKRKKKSSPTRPQLAIIHDAEVVQGLQTPPNLQTRAALSSPVMKDTGT